MNDAEEVARLRKGIQDYLDGNYDHPRKYRPGRCPHGTYYWECCDACDQTYFTALLKPPAASVSKP